MAPQDRRFSKYYVTSGQKRGERYPLVRRSCMLFMLLFSSLWLTACGGGGGDSGTNTPTTPTTPSPAVISRVSSASAATQTAVNAVTQSLESLVGGTASAAPRAFSSAQVQDLGTTIQRFSTALETQGASTPRDVISCPNGGTLNTTSTATGTTLVFANCRTLIDTDGDGRNDAAEVVNGSLSVSQTSFNIGASFSLTADNLTTRITKLTNNSLLEETTLNITLTGTTQSSSTCGGEVVPTALTLVLNGPIALKQDTDGNGTIDVDQNVRAQSFTMTVRITRFDLSSCTPLDLSVAVAGTLAVTDNLNANESFALTSSTSNPLTLALSTVTGGTNITIAGSFSVSSVCFTGALTITTQAPIFSPVDAPCPTAGVLSVTGDQIGTISYTSTGGVTIDEGSNGSIDRTFPSCSGAQACL